MYSMDTKIVHIKVAIETRKKLRLLAAMLDKTIIEVAEQLASEALKKVQTSDRTESL